VHRLCALWSPEVYQEGGDKIRNVMAAVRRGRSLRCSYCFRKGATVGCCVDWCPKTFHIRCAQKAGCEVNAQEWILSCKEHARHKRGKKTKAPAIGKVGRRITEGAQQHLHRQHAGQPFSMGSQPDGVDLDEERFERKQRLRHERDVLSLKPYKLGTHDHHNKIANPSGDDGKGKGVDDGGIGEEANSFSALGWECVGGHEDVIRSLKEAVLLPLAYRKEFARMQLTCPRGILLHGEPGTGKTMVVRALAGACHRLAKRLAPPPSIPHHNHRNGGNGVTFFSRKGADCLGKFHGEAERKLRVLFEEARKSAPSIIFFDELDGLAPVRSSQKDADQIHRSVVSTLLSLMDGLADRGDVVVIAATNRPDSIDPALRRPGRFDREIYFPLPDAKQRLQILQACTRKWKMPSGESHQVGEETLEKTLEKSLEKMATLTDGYAGADLQNLCTQAALTCVRRHFPNILDGIERSQERKFETSDFREQMEKVSVEHKDFMCSLEGMSAACSRRTTSGMLGAVGDAKPLPTYLLPALWKPLSEAASCAMWGGKSSHSFMPNESGKNGGRSFFCPSDVFSWLESKGAVSSRVFLSAREVRAIGQPEHTKQNSASQLLPPGANKHGNANILLCGDASSSKLVGEAVLSTLPELRVVKLSLAQAVLEGKESVAEGMLSLAKKAVRPPNSGLHGSVVLYCPDVHTWFSSSESLLDGSENQPMEEGQDGEAEQSRTWNAFLQVYRAKPANLSVLVLMTASWVEDELPSSVKDLFTTEHFQVQHARKLIVTEGIADNRLRKQVSALAADFLVSASTFLWKSCQDAFCSAGEQPHTEQSPKPKCGEETDAEEAVIGDGEAKGVADGDAKGDGDAEECDVAMNLEEAANGDREEKEQEQEEEEDCQCCICFGPDPAPSKCSVEGCKFRAHSRCLSFLKERGKKQSSKLWTCELCSRKSTYSTSTCNSITEIEHKTIRWVGSMLLQDQRTSLASGSHEDTGLDLLTIATNACKGKYLTLSYLEAGVALAVDAAASDQKVSDRRANKLGVPQRYKVATSAAFAVQDRMSVVSNKFKKFLLTFVPDKAEEATPLESKAAVVQSDPSDVDDSPEDDSAKELFNTSDASTLPPRVFDWEYDPSSAAGDGSASDGIVKEISDVVCSHTKSCDPLFVEEAVQTALCFVARQIEAEKHEGCQPGRGQVEELALESVKKCFNVTQ